MASGWREHIPLTYLTDSYCSRSTLDPDINQELLTVNTTAGIVTTTSKPLSSDGEAHLSFCEWSEAWKRLLRLIQDHHLDEHNSWSIHHNRIRDAEDCNTKWSLWLAYDIEIRRRSCSDPLDPAVFQVNIWQDLQPDFIMRQTMERLRLQYPNLPSAPNLKRKFSPEGRESPNRRPNTSAAPYSAEHFRCFLCAATDHTAKFCRSTKLINGKPLFLRNLSNNRHEDSQGKRYCFSYNGKGCFAKFNSCNQGFHKCTLCGGTHSAQHCKDF
ncbi:hypothetical protein M422DRAFT_42232 [Sphaerobolus stellatus SS14]|nr:hypothetical protein M422DRAFT_42232 [Sphaerobolus stellatus SS14]